MCTGLATTREHVPPRSFYPDEYVTDSLITVPSCAKHNNANAKDVEYVRNILTAPVQVNQIAREFINGKVGRSYDRSPGLLRETFKDIRPVIYNGEQTGMFSVNLDRLDIVIRAMAYGLYRRHFGKRFWGSWVVLSSQFLDPDRIGEEPDAWRQLKFYLRRIQLTPVPVPESRIFNAGVYVENEHRVVFGFVFYEGITIHAVGYPFWKRVPGRGRPTRTRLARTK